MAKKATAAEAFDPVHDFDHAAPCPFCGDHYHMGAPDGADVSGGVALPAFIGHLRSAHPEVTLVDAAYDLVGATGPERAPAQPESDEQPSA